WNVNTSAPRFEHRSGYSGARAKARVGVLPASRESAPSAGKWIGRRRCCRGFRRQLGSDNAIAFFQSFDDFSHHAVADSSFDLHRLRLAGQKIDGPLTGTALASPAALCAAWITCFLSI